MRLLNHFGARLGLIIARLAYIAYLLCLVGIVGGGPIWLVWVMAVMLAVTNAFQWNSQHFHLSRIIHMNHKGRDVAEIDFVDMFMASLAPAISALLAILLNSDWPLYFAIACIVVSMFWLRNIQKDERGVIEEQELSFSLKYAPKRDLLANFAYNISSATTVYIWPMYLALVLPQIGSIGIVATVGAVGASFFLLFIGNRSDKVGTVRVLNEGSVTTFFAHLFRLVPASLGTVTAVNIFGMFAHRYQQNPWACTYLSHVREKGMKYIISMEIVCDLAYLSLFGLMYVILSAFGYRNGFAILFVIAALAALVCTRITPANKSVGK